MGSTNWFDWSDFRLETGVRIYLARLMWGRLARGDKEYDLVSELGLRSDPEPFRDLWCCLYIDRLALRGHYEFEHVFTGRGYDDVPHSLSTLDVSSFRLGCDLDVIRYPFARIGVNFDFYNEPMKIIERREYALNPWTEADGPFSAKTTPRGHLGAQPWTIGVHAKIIPVRVREAPVTVQGRFRYPMPFLSSRPDDSRVTALEASAGMRPSVWETSMFGHSTFSAAVEFGYRAEWMESRLDAQGIQFHAHWQGVFAQFSLAY
jgi:hypothetical protein